MIVHGVTRTSGRSVAASTQLIGSFASIYTIHVYTLTIACQELKSALVLMDVELTSHEAQSWSYFPTISGKLQELRPIAHLFDRLVSDSQHTCNTCIDLVAKDGTAGYQVGGGLPRAEFTALELPPWSWYRWMYAG